MHSYMWSGVNAYVCTFIHWYWCGSMFTFVCTGEHAHGFEPVETWDQIQVFSSIAFCVIHCFLCSMSLHWTWSFANLVSRSSLLWGSLSLPPVSWEAGQIASPIGIYVGAGHLNPSSHDNRAISAHWGISPAPAVREHSKHYTCKTWLLLLQWSQKAGITTALTLKTGRVKLKIIKVLVPSRSGQEIDPASRLSGIDSVLSTPPLLWISLSRGGDNKVQECMYHDDI